MILGFSTGCFYKWSDKLSDQIRIIEKYTDANAIEICLFTDFDKKEFSDKLISSLKKFEYISIHSPNLKGLNQDKIEKILEKISWLKNKTHAQHIVVHPNEVNDFEIFEKYKLDPLYENMDLAKDSFRTAKDFEKINDKNFIFDVCHAYENDKSFELAKNLLDFFGQKIKEIHLSGNNKKQRHVPVVYADDKEKIMNILKPYKDIPIICEGSFEKDDCESVKKETKFVRHSFKNI